MVDILLWTLAFALIVTGIVGVVVPALPGPGLVAAGVLVAAWVDDFGRISLPTVLVVSVLGLASIALDYAATAFGTRRFGGSNWGMAGAVVGVIAGLFFAPVGIVVGPVVGAVLFELGGAHKEWRAALRSGFGALVGLLLGVVGRYAIVAMMLGAAAFSYLM